MGTATTQIEGLIASSGARAVAVVAQPTHAHGPRIAIEPDRVFHAASTMKVPVLVELYRRAEDGELSLDDRLVVHNTFRSIIDRSPFSLDPADDSEVGLYDRDGEAVGLHELAFLAITQSSNLATNLLVDLLDPGRISSSMAALGCPTLVVARGVEDDAAFRAGINNTVTAAGLAQLLATIARGESAGPDDCQEMLEILRLQAFNEGIPAGLPAGTRIAHKTGSIIGLYHDAALVELGDDRDYVLVVLTEGLDETTDAPNLVAAIASIAHDAMVTAS
jgi:beta-lactamase class A